MSRSYKGNMLRPLTTAISMLAAFLATTPLQADMPVRGNALIDIAPQAGSIVIGRVTDVTGPIESQRAGIALSDTVRGAPPGNIAVAGSAKDPELPHFSEGENVLLFLEPDMERGTYRTVGGAAGKFSFQPDQTQVVLDIATEYAGYTESPQTSAARGEHYEKIKSWIDFGDTPPALLAGMLWELESRYTDMQDRQWISDLLNRGEAKPMVLKWALREAGRDRMHELRDTVSQIAEHGPRSLRAQAVRTIGALGGDDISGLTRHLDNTNRSVRQSTVEALMHAASPDAAAALFKRYPHEQSSVVRVAIIDALQRLPQGKQLLLRLESEQPDPVLQTMLHGTARDASAPGLEDPETPAIANDPEDTGTADEDAQ